MSYRSRGAMTVLEVAAALGLLFIAIVFLGQVTLGELTERSRQDSRLQVLEAADNILESARAPTLSTRSLLNGLQRSACPSI